MAFNDKFCVQQIFGSLMKEPLLLARKEKYNLILSDFNTRFEKIIFNAILGLAENGAKTIAPADIENYMNSDAPILKEFKDANGIEYLNDCSQFAETENFDLYYSKLKKLNLLRDLQKSGFDISEFYNDDLLSVDNKAINDNFERLTPKDIVDSVRAKLIKVEGRYAKTAEVEVESMAMGIEDLIEDLRDHTELGLSVQGSIYSRVIGGAQSGALTIRSAPSGFGKTRVAIADACYLAYPVRYNRSTDKWERTPNNERVLFVITEQTFRQVKKMVLAYLTDIDEDRLSNSILTPKEVELLNKAGQIINDFSENLIFARCPDPSIEVIRSIIRENVLTHNITHVFYDYIFISPALLKEFGDSGAALRHDELLLLFATALKDLAVEMNVSVFTSTQVNANADDSKNIRGEACLAGGRSTINKADNGIIMARPSKEELEILEKSSLLSKIGKPNVVSDIFKVRSGKWTQVRIWSQFDLGRMKRKDLLITDAYLNPITDFYDGEELQVVNWGEEENKDIERYIKNLNV